MRTARHYYLIIALVLSLLLAAAGQAQEPGQNRAALVIRFDEGQVESYCVAFEEPEISGLELLQRSGAALEIEDVGLGVTVCRVEETGCPADNCFCQCQGGECRYWSYWLLSEGEWRYSAVGAHLRTVVDGVVEGWSWGPGSVSQAISPPPITFDEVCAEVDGALAQETVTQATAAPGVTEQAAVSTEPPPAEATAADRATADSDEGSGQNELASYAVFGAIALLLLAALVGVRATRGGR